MHRHAVTEQVLAFIVMAFFAAVVFGWPVVIAWHVLDREARIAQRPLMPLDRSGVAESREPRSRRTITSEGGAQGVRSVRSPLESEPWILVNGGGRSETYEVTAYSHGCTLPRSGREKPPQRAANGRWPVADVTVAADAELHAFGTEVLIEGLGFRTVGDRGHAIKGRRLDLFVDSCREALRFGRRRLTVWPVPPDSARYAQMGAAND